MPKPIDTLQQESIHQNLRDAKRLLREAVRVEMNREHPDGPTEMSILKAICLIDNVLDPID